MRPGEAALLAHMAGGATTVCRCWRLTRKDQVVMGFTDHDSDLVFDGLTYQANSGLTAEAISRNTGLSVDNSEAVGALTADLVSEADIAAGRFDGAEIEFWIVNWADLSMRHLRFRGTIGEIRTGGGEFRAELRGLSERLNRPFGRVYQRLCSARFGDVSCGLDASEPRFSTDVLITHVHSRSDFEVDGTEDFATGWFERGRFDVVDGEAHGLSARIKHDRRMNNGNRRLALWEDLRVPLAEDDIVRLVTGCDKQFDTCRERFANTLNFRGFPHLPGDDWLMTVPARAAKGGKRS